METFFGEIEQAHNRLARERVLADLNTLAHDTEDLLKATAQDAKDTVRAARSRAAAALERAKTLSAELQAQGVSNAKTTARNADAMIREHPYKSVGLAFGLGLLIGVLLMGNGDDL